MNTKRVLLTAPAGAIASSGFRKAFLYSFGSWFAAWAVTWLASSEAQTALGVYGVIVPLLNTVFVFLKQYLDEVLAPEK